MLLLIMTAAAALVPQTSLQATECQIIDALFVQETAKLPVIDPKFARSPGRIGQRRSGRPANLDAQFITKLAESLGVPDKAVLELKSAVLASQSLAWKPNCPWSTRPVGMTNAFSRPVMTNDRRLAAFEWDRGIDDPPADRGEICVGFKQEQTWKVACSVSWER